VQDKCVMFPLRFNGPNLVLKYNRTQNRLVNIAIDDSNSPYYALRDRTGNAIGVTACDVDGDGREEIYFLNTNNAYSGKKKRKVHSHDVSSTFFPFIIPGSRIVFPHDH